MDERAVRRRSLALDVRRAISELTHDDPLLLTSIRDVARYLNVDDAYLLCEAFEILAASGDIHVASGIVSVTGKRPVRSIKREQRYATRLRDTGSRHRAKNGRPRGWLVTAHPHPLGAVVSPDRGR